ncbi:hypothetical protein DSECCO2_454740 [anaerobic digester metagenome]
MDPHPAQQVQGQGREHERGAQQGRGEAAQPHVPQDQGQGQENPELLPGENEQQAWPYSGDSLGQDHSEPRHERQMHAGQSEAVGQAGATDAVHEGRIEGEPVAEEQRPGNRASLSHGHTPFHGLQKPASQGPFSVLPAHVRATSREGPVPDALTRPVVLVAGKPEIVPSSQFADAQAGGEAPSDIGQRRRVDPGPGQPSRHGRARVLTDHVRRDDRDPSARVRTYFTHDSRHARLDVPAGRLVPGPRHFQGQSQAESGNHARRKPTPPGKGKNGHKAGQTCRHGKLPGEEAAEPGQKAKLPGQRYDDDLAHANLHPAG